MQKDLGSIPSGTSWAKYILLLFDRDIISLENMNSSQEITQKCEFLVEISSYQWFHSVVVITSALHAEGPGFNPQWNQSFAILSHIYSQLRINKEPLLTELCSVLTNTMNTLLKYIVEKLENQNVLFHFLPLT